MSILFVNYCQLFFSKNTALIAYKNNKKSKDIFLYAHKRQHVAG